jgi:hypothetical protein
VNNGLCKNTDKLTASASRAALVDFYSKFPELRANDFFITGESYGRIVILYPRHLSLSLFPLRSPRTRFSSLVKQNKKGKNCAVFCFAGKRK